jgi:hypothetical protein
MSKYTNGKIYMLEPITTYQQGDVYYGSTIQPLFKRFNQHKYIWNCKSRELFIKYGIDNIKIVLIKSFSCNSKEELEIEEGLFIKENKCLNIKIPRRPLDEIKEINKAYRETNKEKNKEKVKKHYKANREDILKKAKEYKEENKEKIKEHYKANREEILKKRKEYRETNREKVLKQKKDYRERHKEKIKEAQKKYCQAIKEANKK